MTFNPFSGLDGVREAAVAAINAAYADAAFINDTVFQGRTIPNEDELPCTLAYFDDPKIKAAMAREDSSTEHVLCVHVFSDSSRMNPDRTMELRGKAIWTALDLTLLDGAKERCIGQGYEYVTDPDTQVVSLVIKFLLTI